MIEPGLVALLQANATIQAEIGGRVYLKGQVPKSVLASGHAFLTYQVISSVEPLDMDGPVGFADTRVQLDWYGTPAAVHTIRLALAVLNGYQADLGDYWVGLGQVEDARDEDEPPPQGQDRGPAHGSAELLLSHETTAS